MLAQWLFSWMISIACVAAATASRNHLVLRQNGIDLASIKDQVNQNLEAFNIESPNDKAVALSPQAPIIITLTDIYKIGFFDFLDPTFIEQKNFFGNLVFCGYEFTQEMIRRHTCSRQDKVTAQFIDCQNYKTRFYVVNQQLELTYDLLATIIAVTGGFLAETNNKATKFWIARIDNPTKVSWAGGIGWNFLPNEAERLPGNANWTVLPDPASRPEWAIGVEQGAGEGQSAVNVS